MKYTLSGKDGVLFLLYPFLLARASTAPWEKGEASAEGEEQNERSPGPDIMEPVKSLQRRPQSNPSSLCHEAAPPIKKWRPGLSSRS